MRNTLLILTLGMTFACRASSNTNHNPDAPKTGDGGTSDGVVSTTIKAIRMTQPTNGTMIALTNVVVVANVTSKKYGHVWVQDQGGGAYSGIQLFCNYGGTHPTCSMTQPQIDALTVGTVVNVTGAFSSFLLSTAPPGAAPVLEIDAPTITASGGTMPPVAIDVPVATLAKANLTAGGPADPYKGTYVHVTGATAFPATSIAASEFSMTCQGMGTPPTMGTSFGGFEVSGGGQTLAIGLNFYKSVTYCLPCTAAMPYPCANAVTSAENFTSVSGIVEPNYNCGGPTCPGTNPSVYLQISPTNDLDLPHS